MYRQRHRKSGGPNPLAEETAALVDCTPERTAAKTSRRRRWRQSSDSPGFPKPANLFAQASPPRLSPPTAHSPTTPTTKQVCAGQRWRPWPQPWVAPSARSSATCTSSRARDWLSLWRGDATGADTPPTSTGSSTSFAPPDTDVVWGAGSYIKKELKIYRTRQKLQNQEKREGSGRQNDDEKAMNGSLSKVF